MIYFVYVLLSKKDGKYYIGMTGDLNRRLQEHRDGKVESTKHRKPLECMCCEVYRSKKDAQMRERYLKTSDGRKELRIRLKESIRMMKTSPGSSIG